MIDTRGIFLILGAQAGAFNRKEFKREAFVLITVKETPQS